MLPVSSFMPDICSICIRSLGHLNQKYAEMISVKDPQDKN